MNGLGWLRLIKDKFPLILIRNAAKLSKAQSTGKKRFRLPVECTEAQRLVNFVNGSNYFKEGEDIQIKNDSEYPDWIWELKLDPPKGLDGLDPESKEYWERLAFLNEIRKKRLMAVRPKPIMAVGEHRKNYLEYVERMKFRALAALDYDAGWDLKECGQELNPRMYLRPQKINEPLYVDEFELPSLVEKKQ